MGLARRRARGTRLPARKAPASRRSQVWRQTSLWIVTAAIVIVALAQVIPVAARQSGSLLGAVNPSGVLASVLAPASSLVTNATSARSAAKDSLSAEQGHMVASTCLGGQPGANLIQAENTCPGTTSWRANLPFGSANAIAGFTNPASVDIGQSIQLYVTTTASTFFFQIYRMGWYQGNGARLLYSSATQSGIEQPNCTIAPGTKLVSCANWRDPQTLIIPTTWVSGIYLIKLVSSAGYMRYDIFVVRDDASHAPIIAESALMTFQAYNSWGGYSLYGDDSLNGAQADAVSLDRPSDLYGGMGLFPQQEYDLVRWLERNGYDMTYAADIDLALHPAIFAQHRLILVAGHDEYWSTQMRDQITADRDAGISLAYFSANTDYWHVRLQASPFGADRVIVCYKSAALDPITRVDPTEATTQWREHPVSDPESSLLGEMFAGIPTRPAPLVLARGAQPFLAGTGLRIGVPLPVLVNGEVDSAIGNGATPASLIVLTATHVVCADDLCYGSGGTTATATVYTAASGARVFDAGTFYWSWGLENSNAGPWYGTHSYANAGFQRFTANILAYLLAA